MFVVSKVKSRVKRLMHQYPSLSVFYGLSNHGRNSMERSNFVQSLSTAS